MTGFIRGLFGGKNDDNKADNKKKEDNAYFLDNDSSKTFGNIDYMRMARTVKKSFPKGLGEVEETMSSIDKIDRKGVEVAEEKEVKAEEKILPQAQFRKPDGIANASTNMDMFRKMAKEIKKGN